MSKADEMLKQNGFYDCSIEELKYRKETRQWRENGYLEITFNEDKTFDVSFNNSLPVFISMKELQAINEKVKELGWEGNK